MAVTVHKQLGEKKPLALGGLPVRTDLRAGLTLEDLDNKVEELWNKLTSSLSGTESTTPSSASIHIRTTPSA